MSIYQLKAYEKQAIWGGKKLFSEYGKKSYTELAETWELSGLRGKESIVCGGEFDGLTINELITSLGGKNILGTHAPIDGSLPLLIKFIDSASPLSIQVHPNDKVAQELGNGAASKTEMWVICEADDGAFLYFGMKRKLSPERFGEALKDGSIIEYLNRVPVKKGDVFFIPSGTIHAIGAGITICEIQQTSDTTYRLYDYGRIDKDGKPRQLHIEEGKRAANLKPLEHFYEIPSITPDGGELLYRCDFFTVYRRFGGKNFFVGDDSFSALTAIDGMGKVSCEENWLDIRKGDTVFIPANSGKITLSGDIVCIDSRL